MSYNTIRPLPEKSDNPNEKVRKLTWYSDDIKKALVTAIDTVDKEETTDRVEKKEKKPNVLEESINLPIS